MYKGKINKKTAIIAAVLIFATIISVFAISNAIQASKAAKSTNISPYKYGLVVAYYGYWKTGDSYFADVDYPGQRKNIGKVPSEYAEFDLTFPTTLIEGNYEIDRIIDLKDYTGSWSDLNYSNMSQSEVRDHYIEQASIWSPQAYIGEKNTEVTFTASFRLLNPPNLGFPGSTFAKDMSNGVYKCYIAVVIKYVDSDYLADPEGWWDDHGGNPNDPGDGDITVTIKYVDEDDKKLMSDKTRKTSLGANLIENSERIDGYKCTGYSITGKETKSFLGNSTSFVMGLFGYSTPVNNNLNITFHYEEYEEPEKPKCDPQFDTEAEDKRVTMKRRDFDNATDIFFSNMKIGIDDFEGGFKQISGTEWEEVEGDHKFHSFDIYLKYPGSTSYDFTRYDISSKTAYQNLNVPAVKFTPTNTEKTEYIAEVEVTLGVFCTCGGFNAEKTTLRLYVDIVENKPPTAFYRYATKKILPSGTESRVYGKAYIGKDVVIDNYCDDPNGSKDIDHVRYTFKNINDSGQVKSIQFKMMPWGKYELDEADNFEDTSIILNGYDNGNLNVVFTTNEDWEVTVYVQDTEGLNDTYTETIRPEVLSLNPIAVIKDTLSYRYPIDQEFNGKQNRVIKLDSNSSYVASWLHDMDITIDHSKDMWEIEPLDGQNINSVKFERDINKLITSNVLNARYEPLNIKMMFKEPGRYKIRLQVTDTDGNVSEWTEQVLTINEDLPPTVTADVNPKYYRNTSKVAKISFYALPQSQDNDLAFIDSIGYKFDSNNNGNFDDETLNTTGITTNEVNIDGYIYTHITVDTNKVGKYQFIINSKEKFNQEAIDKYIIETDYKSASIVLQTEVDNIQPVATLGTHKINNIDVKIITSGLSGTKNSDVQVNLSNLKNQLESQPNIKIGNIEVIDLANRVNGLLDENSLTWRKVTMGGWIAGRQFPYIEKDPIPSMPPETPLVGNWIDPLPNGVYADGWNGLTVPKLLINGNMYTRLYSDVNYENKHGDVEVKSNFYLMDYNNNYVEIGNLNGSRWGAELGDVSDFSAVTNEKIKDFDIGFTFTDSPKGFPGNPLDKHIGDRYLLFNIKDKNNYYAYFDVHYNYKYDGESWATDYFDENVTSGFLRIVNGKKTNIRLYYKGDGRIGHGDDDYNYNIHVNRLVQVGNSLKAYDTQGKIALDLELEDGSTGGHLGLAATAALSMNTVRLNIDNLSYIGNSNIGEAVDKFNWDSDSDKYIINLAEGSKLEELTNQNILNKTATKLQEKDINIINVGVNSINGSKLKEITTKNLNNGTYFELGNISANFSSSANYIKAKYNSNSDTGDIYVLLDDNLSYTENYTDAELDTKFLSEYKYSQNATYFENNLGTINNNNTWIKEPIDITNKTGKYTVSFRVKDNPLYPDTSIFNLFNSYRKYSEEFKKNIYVHRKPISSFSVDNSFVKNLLKQYNQNYDSISLRLRMPPNPNAWDIVYDYDDYTVYNNYTWFFKYFGLKTRIEYRNYYRDLDSDWRYSGTLDEPICDPNDRNFYDDNRRNLKDDFNIRSYSSYQNYFEDRLEEYYDNIEYRGDLSDSVIIDVNIPSNAINATLHYKTSKEDDNPYTKILADGVQIERVYDNVEKTISIPNGTQKLEFYSSGRYWNSGDSIYIYDVYTHYYLEDTNINIPINESSYDLDHISISNKGIVEWQWKIVNKNGITSLYNTTNRVNGTNWVSNQLKNQQWHDATVFLRVKDLEGAYSDWTSTFISEKNLLDPGTNNDDITAVKPIANFLIDKDPLKLNAETQIITDTSYDKDGYTLTNIWNVYKEDNFLFMNTQKNINTQLNDEIKKNGVGNYTISLKVVNSKGIYSDTVTKSFKVTIYNDAPTVNFNLVSNENPVWTFPKTLGLYTLRYRPSNTLFIEEHARFDTNVNDPNTDNTGFIYNWRLERFAVKNINNISGAANNTYRYTTQYPFTNSFKRQGLPWGAYRITLNVTDKPPIPPYQSSDAKSATVTKNYYIVPEISLEGSFQSDKSEIMVGDSIKLKAKTNKMAETVGCNLNGTGYVLSKVSEDSNYAYWEKNITIPESITESGTYQLQFVGKTTYGGSGNVTREVKDNVPIDIVALKLINFRITDIVNHPYITFPQTKDMLKTQLIPYKAGYYVTFRIDSKGKPDNVYGRIDVGNNGTIDQNINMKKVVTGDTETWQGRFYSSAHLPVNTVISIKLDCLKGSVIYNYNEKESWDGRSLIVNGSALQDARVNLTN